MLRKINLCLLSGALLALSFPALNIWLFAWFGFVPLLYVLKNKSKGKAFLFSYFTGVIFWSAVIYWLVHVTLPGTIILVLYLALYFGIFGLVISSIGYKLSTIGQLLFIPSVWVLLEYVRSYLFTGFGWALLGYSQYLNLPIIQIADITGVWGISFLLMMANVSIYSLGDLAGYSLTSVIKKCFIPLLCIILALGYGYYKIYWLPGYPVTRSTVKISLVQGNIAQELKWMPTARDYILAKFSRLTEQAASENPDLIVWPEASSPGFLGEDAPVFKASFL